ncbi:MAG: hypothetical protein ACLQG3_11635 [Terracidiphilus sp.]
MNDENPLEQIREDVEARQRATDWPDTLRNGATIDAFLWKGDPHAKPVQRIGLIVFALTFLLLGVSLVSIPFEKNFEDGSSIVFFVALPLLLLSVRLLRNAFLRPAKHRECDRQIR